MIESLVTENCIPITGNVKCYDGLYNVDLRYFGFDRTLQWRYESKCRETFKMYILRCHFLLLNYHVSCAFSHQDLSYCKISQAFLHLITECFIFLSFSYLHLIKLYSVRCCTSQSSVIYHRLTSPANNPEPYKLFRSKYAA